MWTDWENRKRQENRKRNLEESYEPTTTKWDIAWRPSEGGRSRLHIWIASLHALFYKDLPQNPKDRGQKL